jgi:hypothetical protein
MNINNFCFESFEKLGKIIDLAENVGFLCDSKMYWSGV